MWIMLRQMLKLKRRISFIIRALRFFISYELFFCLAACTALWCSLIIYFFKVGLWDVVDLLPTKIFLVLLFLNRLSGFFSEIYRRRKTALLTVGLLVVLSGFFLNYAYRFEGSVSLGEGERFSGYDRQEKGPLSKPLEISFAVGKVEGNPLKLDKEAKAEIYNDNIKATLVPGQYKRWSSGIRVGILGIELAPRVLITDKTGKLLHSTFVKLKLYPQGLQDYFLIGLLPHRFYVTLTGKDDKPFNLKILRGKLIVSNQDIAVGEEVEFDGLKASFPELARWVLINVRYYPGNSTIYIGIAIILIGSIVVLFGLRSTNDIQAAH